MLRQSALAIGLCVLCLAPTISSAQHVFSTAQFEAYIAQMRVNLSSVFDQVIRHAIVMSTDASFVLDEAVLKFDDVCDLIPYFEPNANPKEIRVDSEEFIALSSYVSQVILFYLIGMPEVDKPERVTNYIETVVRPFMADLYADCSRVSPVRTSLSAVIELSYFNTTDYKGRLYGEVLRAAANRPRALLTADYVGGLPAFFIILHEIGHHVQIDTGQSFETRAASEFDAAAKAAEILKENDLSPTLALPVMHAFAVGDHADELECRLATLARSDRDTLTRTSELPFEYRQRLDALREHYAERYRSACS